MASFNEPTPYSFARLCDVYKEFSIPNFQRPYAWKNKNITDFWASVVSNENDYFVGNIVCVAPDQDRQSLLIIDGQQRLTTISLILAAIRDSYPKVKSSKEEDNINISQSIQRLNLYLKGTDLNPIPARNYTRLSLGKDEYQQVYDQIISGVVVEESSEKYNDFQKKYIKNYQTINQLVKEYITGSELERLQGLEQKLLSLQFIAIVCTRENDIYGIFEGLNSTGLGLSVADLLKNALLRTTTKDNPLQEKVEENWEELESLFQDAVSKFPTFLRHQWISEEGYVSGGLNLYKDIKKKVIDNKKNNKDILEYTSLLLTDAKLYLGISYSDKRQYLNYLESLNETTIEVLRPFSYLHNQQIYEVLLTYIKKHLNSSETLGISTLNKILRKLWIFSVRTNYISISPSDYERAFASHCTDVKAVKNSEELSAISNSFINKLKHKVSASDQFIENFVSDVSYPADSKLILYALREIVQNDSSTKSITTKKPNIEHIIPKQPENWKIEKSAFQEYSNNIGNLTILNETQNSEMGNKGYTEKMNIYSQDSFKINRDIVVKYGKLFKDSPEMAVRKRGHDIAVELESIWSL